MGTQTMGAKRLSLKLILSVTVVVAVAAAAYVVWTQSAQNAAVESKALAEARTLDIEMRAVWNYIDDSQQAINYNADGSYDFKGIYCSMAGKAIAQRFTRESNGYVIRYVRENPRSSTDVPDRFEQTALNHFTVGGSNEHYEMAEYEGRPVFRYASVLPVKRNCLQCHGDPAGTPDETGFLREGMEQGDVAGAVSIIIPVDSYVQEAHAEFVRSVGFFCLLAAAIVAVLLLAMKLWVSSPLERANRQLERESQQKSDFLAVMSHELRTPLTSIIAYTDIWEKERQTSPEAQEQFVREIKQSSAQLLEMVNNTIDVARLDAGRLELQWDETDLFDVVGEVMATSVPLAQKRGVRLSHEVDYDVPIIYSDEEALRKILLNLVSNAIKFTEPGGSVRLAVCPDAPGWIRMEVADTGMGISEGDLAHIFEKFSQVGQTEHSGGSGIGLFLVKSLAESLGGSVSVSSELEKGSTFTVMVPVGREASRVGDDGDARN
ncbi:DUF3365 domain-containing protein [Adlercreutzia sp. R21]|uniref:ATP-binding protein n=1 Tax=Adlercreutzia wanghongyangiae TaxID=3111451 RepID=UPI002DBA237F|nr:DUF3365 domain-containing protein [Adlercreutzia sp. R21]MEC4183553.1 DUF3365 domain-containing protein [Adlercreutzia sp. R21]